MAPYNEQLMDARRAYMDAALAEMNAVANMIDLDDFSDDKVKLLQDRAAQLGNIAQTKFTDFLNLAISIYPDSPILQSLAEPVPGHEN